MNAKEIVHRAGEIDYPENITKLIPPFIMRKMVLGFTKKHNRPPTPKELEALESSVVRNYFCKTKHNFVTGEDEGIEVSRYGLDENGKTVKLTKAQMKELVEIAMRPLSEEDKKKIKEFAENYKTVIY